MISWIAILCCWAVSFVFAGIEGGLLAIDPVRLRHHVKQRSRAALRLNELLKQPERLLVTVLLVTNLADIFALLILTRQFVGLWGVIGYFAAFALSLPVYMFVLGFLPKTLFRRFPFRALAGLAGLLELSTAVLAPVLALGAGVGRLFLRRNQPEQRRLFAAREELKQLAVESEREGSLTPAERAMIHNVVDFRAVKVRDVMIPLPKVVSVSPDETRKELLARSVATGVDQLPVISPTGEATGVINVLDVLLDQHQRTSLQPYIRRSIATDESESAYRVIRRLRAARLSLATVLNQQRQVCGVVTIDDMIKRLVQSA